MNRAGNLLRRFAPRGFLARSLLIILIPLIVLQIVALITFYGGHLDVISRRLAHGVAGDAGMVVELLGRHPESAERGWIFREAAWRLELTLAFEEGAAGTHKVPDLARDPVHVHCKADPAIADKGQPQFLLAHTEDVAGRDRARKGALFIYLLQHLIVRLNVRAEFIRTTLKLQP